MTQRRTGSETDGLRLLRRWLSERTQTDLAVRLGISQAAISQWLSGSCRPEPHYRAAVERITGIPADKWLTAAERRVAFGRTGTDS